MFQSERGGLEGKEGFTIVMMVDDFPFLSLSYLVFLCFSFSASLFLYCTIMHHRSEYGYGDDEAIA